MSISGDGFRRGCERFRQGCEKCAFVLERNENSWRETNTVFVLERNQMGFCLVWGVYDKMDWGVISNYARCIRKSLCTITTPRSEMQSSNTWREDLH